MTRRKGRGRLSSIELLPPEAGPLVAWARQELADRNHTQQDILEEFNKRLRALAAELGRDIAPISSSAFNRHTIRLAIDARRLEETSTIVTALMERRDVSAADDLTIIVAETLKTLVYELLEKGGEAGWMPKQAMEMARALHSAVSAQSVSAEMKRRIEKDFAAKATKAIDQVGKQKGLTAETVASIKASILGVKEAA